MKAVKIGLGIGALAAVIAGFRLYEHYSDLHPATDDAYVIANVVRVAPQVSGSVTELLIADQQYVHKGDLLYTIDKTPFALATESASARLEQARLGVARNSAGVASAQAEVKRREVLLDNAAQHERRSRQLQNDNYLSAQAVEDATAEVHAARAALAVARAQLVEAQRQLGQQGNDNAAVRTAQAELDQLQWQLAHAEVHAACDGRIAEKHLNVGDGVMVGEPNFILICDSAFWIEANFKETELAHIRAGQPATISLDMYPGLALQGRVQSVGGASGVAFSLLPPQNATGNWVKVTQRVPVKIRVLNPDADHPLRVGTSATVHIDTTAPLLPAS